LETARQQHGETIRRETVLVDELRVIDERLAGRDMLAEIAETQAQLEQRRDELTAALAQADERDRLILNRNKLLAEMDELNAKAEQLRRRADEVDMAHDESATCDRCGQHLDAEARKRAVASYQADARDLEQRAKDIDDQAQEYARQIEQLPAERPDREQLAVFHDEIQRAQHAQVQLAALDEAANRKAAVVSEIAEVRASLPERERAVTTAQNELRALARR
jgi:DNA repair exonuclease SbcCD ATPase subunit